MIVSKYIYSSNLCVFTVLVGQEIDHRPYIDKSKIN